VSGNIFNSRGIHVGLVIGSEIFDLAGKKLYDLKGSTYIVRSANWWGIWTPREAQTSVLLAPPSHVQTKTEGES
jgi:hypothetical protein